MKKIYVLVFTAMVTIGLLGCNNSNNMFEKENKSDLKKDMFVSTFEENSDLIKTVCLGNNSNRSAIASEEAEYDYYINNPSALYEDLLQEENGAEYIEYFTKLSNYQLSSDEILECSKSLLSESDYAQLETNIKEKYNIDLSESSCRAAIDKDKVAHFFAGAAVALESAALVYAVTPAILVKTKIILAATVSVAAGVAAGALKELYDSAGHGTVDIKDFWFTSYGSATGSIISAAVGGIVFTITSKPTAGVIICGVFGLVCGYEALHIVGIL